MTVRIILDAPYSPAISWCWRDDWYTGMCSAYGLILKFGLLNAVTAKDIANAFISKRCGVKTETCARPYVDLRDAKLFDIGIMADVFRISPDEIRASFLYELLPDSSERSSENLRWCEACMARGFHTPIFQMKLLSACPIHQMALRTSCRHCGQPIPYRLQQELLIAPFCCPHCKEDMAPGLRVKQPGALLPRPYDRASLKKVEEFLALEQDEICEKMEMDSRVQQYGQGELIFSKPEVDGSRSRYLGFVSQVISQLHVSETDAQASLAIERIERAERGTSAAIHQDDVDPALRYPSWANGIAGADDHDTGSKEPIGESELRSVTVVYRAIRRHVWKHVLRGHRRCVVAAARHLWWKMDEEVTASFCPVAEAFIRWQMLWEGCGTPRYLFGAQRRELHGLIGWVSSRPSPCPTHWSRATQHWVVDHIFANACLESLRERLSEALGNDTKGTIYWQRPTSPVRYDTYWAVTGSDIPSKPAVIHLRCPMPHPAAAYTLPSGRRHFTTHSTRLASIAR